ncbi:hypothetical protein [uncultured Methanoregula sp.]|uniref:hypothetical protein n=1 Tax=uncultured Methanoregula sp. TaxID=1005933 RepID=UPI002AAA7C09|nr:hypothetical protein [uncultured Methanoregula sp.]
MRTNNTKTTRAWRIAAIALLLFVAIVIVPVAADPQWPGYQKIYITPENGIRFDKVGNGTYYFKLTGGGLNALHITNDPINATEGQVTTTTSQTGHFWITDTGGRAYDDDAILFVAVNGSDNSAFSVTITSSGYNWTPTGDGLLPPIGTIAYKASALNNVQFTSANFAHVSGTDVNTYWRPSTASYYPVFSGENIADTTNNNFNFIPIDLKIGIIGTSANSTYNGSLIDHGATRIDYTIDNIPYDGVVAFNAYAWCNQSNQGQAVSWTNAVNKSTQGPSTAYSGWMVTPP